MPNNDLSLAQADELAKRFHAEMQKLFLEHLDPAQYEIQSWNETPDIEKHLARRAFSNLFQVHAAYGDSNQDAIETYDRFVSKTPFDFTPTNTGD